MSTRYANSHRESHSKSQSERDSESPGESHVATDHGRSRTGLPSAAECRQP
jgi:hypothetical protein